MTKKTNETIKKSYNSKEDIYINFFGEKEEVKKSEYKKENYMSIY